MIQPKAVVLALLGCALAGGTARAQATRLIEPSDPAYRDLDQLIDNGLVSQLSLRQRPISRAALARAVNEAAQRLRARRTQLVDGALPGHVPSQNPRRLEFLGELIASLRSRFDLPDSVTEGARLPTIVAPLLAVSLDAIRSDAPTRAVPGTNGLGSIDARLNPLLANRQGRTPTAGTSGLLETFHSVESEYVAFTVVPQLSIASNEIGTTRTNIRVEELQSRLVVRNLALDVGREYVMWGQGRDGGLLNSNNSPPLDVVKLSSEQPFVLPWFFRHLGPARLALYYADLGADQNFPHAYAIAYRWNILPEPWLELGVSVYTKSGGKGAPPATKTARLIDLLPFLDASAYNNVFGTRGNFEFSDHYAGFDGRLRVPHLASSVFWEVLLNDFDVRRLKSVLWEDAGHILGAELPPLLQSGRLRASVEYHHTGIRYYEHQQFTSGQTVHHVLTGDPLGPNAQGGYVFFDWLASRQRRSVLQLALERRSNDQYAFVPEPHFGFSRIAVQPKEWRGRIVGNWQLLPDRRALGALLQFGYERVHNFNFVDGDDRNGFLARGSMQYRFF